jgi:hypothetical protein
VKETANVAANKKAIAFDVFWMKFEVFIIVSFLIVITILFLSFLSFDTAKLGRFSAGCSLFCVFLLSLFGQQKEFWPKLSLYV